MLSTIKKIALVTTGLVVGVVVGRMNERTYSNHTKSGITTLMTNAASATLYQQTPERIKCSLLLRD